MWLCKTPMCVTNGIEPGTLAGVSNQPLSAPLYVQFTRLPNIAKKPNSGNPVVGPRSEPEWKKTTASLSHQFHADRWVGTPGTDSVA